MNFSFIVHVPIPNLKGTNRHVRRLAAPLLAFSTDGTKFAASMNDGAVSVCDVRRKIPLKVFEVDVPRANGNERGGACMSVTHECSVSACERAAITCLLLFALTQIISLGIS